MKTAVPDHTPVLVADARTPVGRLGGALRRVEAVDLGAAAIAGALDRARGIQPEYTVLGNVVQAGNGQNPARVAATRAGLPHTVPGITLNDVCLASMSAVRWAAAQIRSGELNSALVGGFESMTRAPHGVATRVAPRVGHTPMTDLLVHDGLWCSLTDTGMGELSDAENARLGLTRAEQDRFAAESHRRAHEATTSGALAEHTVPVPGTDLKSDEGIRADTTQSALAQLPPAFTEDGTLTAANSSQMSDAGAAGILTSAGRARAAGFHTVTQVVDATVLSGPDATLHLKPARAARELLRRNDLSSGQIDLWEINEAFAGVALASANELDISLSALNIWGGAVALGHPLGASGFRLVQSLAHQLRHTGGELGIAAICGGGGQGQAILLRHLKLT